MDYRTTVTLLLSLWSQFPLQWQSDVHLRAALTHLHSPLHPFLHPHLNSSEHEATAPGSNVQNRCHPCVALFCQPYVSGEGLNYACPHTYPPGYTARFVCWRRAAIVGGKLSIELPLVVNMIVLPGQVHGSFCASAVIRKYTNASNTDTQSTLSSDGSVNKVENTGVTSLKDFHMSNAVLFPLPANEDTVSQPVKAWNMGRESGFLYPSSLAMSCAGMYLRCLPVPKATQISVSSRLTTVDTARTRTSVSTISKIILRHPLFAEPTAWKSILVSASSCVHGARDEMSWRTREHSKLWPHVV